VNDVKSIVSSNPILKLHAADAGITDIANASEADLVDYMHQNPAAQTTILNNLKANKFAQADQLVASAKEAKAAGDIDSSVDLLQQAKDIKSDYNTFANQINRTAQWKLA